MPSQASICVGISRAQCNAVQCRFSAPIRDGWHGGRNQIVYPAFKVFVSLPATGLVLGEGVFRNRRTHRILVFSLRTATRRGPHCGRCGAGSGLESCFPRYRSIEGGSALCKLFACCLCLRSARLVLMVGEAKRRWEGGGGGVLVGTRRGEARLL